MHLLKQFNSARSNSSIQTCLESVYSATAIVVWCVQTIPCLHYRSLLQIFHIVCTYVYIQKNFLSFKAKAFGGYCALFSSNPICPKTNQNRLRLFSKRSHMVADQQFHFCLARVLPGSFHLLWRLFRRSCEGIVCRFRC